MAIHKTTSNKKLLLLKSYPWLLLGTGIFSLWWDFPDYQWILMGYTISLENILRFSSSGAIIGFLTNWIAIAMLFRPYYKRPLLRQGLIPAQKERIINRLSIAISENLINADILSSHLSSVDSVTHYRVKLTNYINNYITKPNVKKKIQVIIMKYAQKIINDRELMSHIADKIASRIQVTLEEDFFNKIAIRTYTAITQQNIKQVVQRTLERFPTQLVTETHQIEPLLDKLSDYIQHHSKDIEKIMSKIIIAFTQHINIKKIIEHNLYQFEEQKLENMIKNATMGQLLYIQYLGAILGTFGGLIIWQTFFF